MSHDLVNEGENLKRLKEIVEITADHCLEVKLVATLDLPVLQEEKNMRFVVSTMKQNQTIGNEVFMLRQSVLGNSQSTFQTFV